MSTRRARATADEDQPEQPDPAVTLTPQQRALQQALQQQRDGFRREITEREEQTRAEMGLLLTAAAERERREGELLDTAEQLRREGEQTMRDAGVREEELRREAEQTMRDAGVREEELRREADQARRDAGDREEELMRARRDATGREEQARQDANAREELARREATVARRALAELRDRQPNPRRDAQPDGRREEIMELADVLRPVQNKIKAPTFNGKRDVRKFLAVFEEVRRNNRWTEEQASLNLRLALDDSISSSVQGDTYDEIRTFLLSRYELTRDEARRELKAARPKKGESIYDFGDHVLQMVKLANPNAQEETQEETAIAESRQ
jgi:hypothetical protein